MAIQTINARLIAAVLGVLVFPAAASARPDYIGKWYLDDPVVCTGAPEETDGLLTYTAHEFIGLENRCRIVRATKRADGTELRMRCLGEGHPYRTREVVKVIADRLHRSLNDGGEWVTYTYGHCPAKKR